MVRAAQSNSNGAGFTARPEWESWVGQMQAGPSAKSPISMSLSFFLCVVELIVTMKQTHGLKVPGPQMEHLVSPSQLQKESTF